MDFVIERHNYLESSELLSLDTFLLRTKRISCSQNRRSSGVEVYGAATSLIWSTNGERLRKANYLSEKLL